jgi:hypothetical protein
MENECGGLQGLLKDLKPLAYIGFFLVSAAKYAWDSLDDNRRRGVKTTGDTHGSAGERCGSRTWHQDRPSHWLQWHLNIKTGQQDIWVAL